MEEKKKTIAANFDWLPEDGVNPPLPTTTFILMVRQRHGTTTMVGMVTWYTLITFSFSFFLVFSSSSLDSSSLDSSLLDFVFTHRQVAFSLWPSLAIQRMPYGENITSVLTG